MKTLYLAKEPGLPVRDDLSRISGEITIVDCLNGYGDWYRKKSYNCISNSQFFELKREDMKFDFILGNPPYTDTKSVVGATDGGCSKGLDDIFYKKCMELSDNVSLVIRSKHFAKLSSKFRRELFSSGHVESIRFLPESTFPCISLTQTCVVTYSKQHVGQTKITYLDGNVVMMTLKHDTCLKANNSKYDPCVDNNMAHRYERGSTNLNQLNGGLNPMIITMGKRDGDMIVEHVDTQCCNNQHGVVMNSKYGGKGFGKIMIKPYEYSISGSSIILKTNSLEESQRLKLYLEREEIYNMSVSNKISNANTKELFMSIPDMPCDSP